MINNYKRSNNIGDKRKKAKSSEHLTNKKAISMIISYVLLISLTIMMAGAVYVWLKGYIQQPVPEESCPEGISLIIQDYKCNSPSTGLLNLTVKNQGTFRVDGYLVKINPQESTDSATPGRYPLCTPEAYYNSREEKCSDIDVGNQIKFIPALDPGKMNVTLFNFSEYKKIRQIEILPMRNKSICSNRVIAQPLSCNLA